MVVLKHLIVYVTSASSYFLQLNTDFTLSKEQDRQRTYNVVQPLLQCKKISNLHFSENVLAALGIQHVRHMRHTVMRPVRLYSIFHALKTARFLEKKFLSTKLVFWFSLQLFLKFFSF